jgi:hypothetical protein
MSFEDELSDVTDEAIAFFGTDNGQLLILKYEGADVRYFEEDQETSLDLILGGIADVTDKVVRCRRDSFPPGSPQDMESVLISARRWKIHAIKGSAGDPELRLVLRDPNRRS